MECGTCKYNGEDVPHTCDVCKSLDAKDFCMYEPKEDKMKIYVITESWGQYEDRCKMTDKAFYYKADAEDYVAEKNKEINILKEQYDKCQECNFKCVDYDNGDDIDTITLMCECVKYDMEINADYKCISCNNQIYDYDDISYYDIEEVSIE